MGIRLRSGPAESTYHHSKVNQEWRCGGVEAFDVAVDPKSKVGVAAGTAGHMICLLINGGAISSIAALSLSRDREAPLSDF